MKKLVVAIDPGFDGAKIVINKQTYHIPFVVEDITSVVSNFPVARSDKKFIRCEMKEKIYLVGEYARKSMQEAEHQENARAEMDTFYTIGRFGTTLFEVGLNAFLGYALYKYQEDTEDTSGEERFTIDNMSEWEIHVGVALPHQHQDELWTEHVKGYLTAHHEFKLYIGSENVIEFNFKLDEKNCVYNSQAVCALIDAVTDDSGKMMEENKTIFDYLPALILDGGYKTLGKFKLSRDGRMDKAESNSTFAMNNINEAVAADVRKKVPNMQGYMIEEKYNNKEVVYFEEDGEVKNFDIVAMRDVETIKMANNLMDYLMLQHNKLLDIKLLLLAGGTGSAYFNTINEFCNNRANLKGNVILAKSGFDGKECEPVYAIAVGLYKAMINDIG